MNNPANIPEDELFGDADEDVEPEVEQAQDENDYNGDYNDEETEEEEDDDYYDEDFEMVLAKVSKMTTQMQTKKIRVENCTVDLPGHVTNLMFKKQRQDDESRLKIKDKYDRATTEQVLDRRGKIILFSFLNKGFIQEINGCVSTGKEANVYHASRLNECDVAIKIFMTSQLRFRNRKKYVEGEFRFRNAYSQGNNFKKIKTWAEKEMRNLARMHRSGIRVPQPIILRSHILVMEFIGQDGWPAPKLQDANLSVSSARKIYRELCIMMWRMYNVSKLIHSDLSEYNILYFNGLVYIIDVSQSVEHDHPFALEFLRIDCTNVTDFFLKKGVATLTVKELFDFITDLTITEENMEECLDKLSEIAESKAPLTNAEQVSEEVFKHAYIPRKLDDVLDFERDMKKTETGDDNDIMYRTLIGLKKNLSGAAVKPEILSDKEESDSDGDSDEDSDGTKTSKFVNSARSKHETLEEKKARKHLVKSEKAEKRKTKIKKHTKKRQMQISKK